MTEGESPVASVRYREGDTPIALPGLAVVAVKLMGLYSIIVGVPQLVFAPMFLFGSSGGSMFLPSLVYPGLQIAVGVFLLACAEWVVARIVRVPDEDALPVTPNEHFQGVAFSIVGVLLMTWAAAEIAKYFGAALMSEASRGRGAVVGSVFRFQDYIRPLVELAAGLYLFLRGRGLASLWHRMRYGGVRVREVE
jgi:hypothetical protein